MVKNFLLIVVVLAVGLVATILMQPEKVQVTRSQTINAPAEAIFPHINNLRQWHDWSPWAKLDPNSIAEFNGPEQGVGMSMHWAGNQEVGEGTMTITDSVPNQRVTLKLEFTQPFEDTSHVFLTLTPVGEATEVTWAMHDTQEDFMSKLFGLVFNVETMVGPMYEKGLANLKGVVEGSVKD